jgi:hypothetical protein
VERVERRDAIRASLAHPLQLPRLDPGRDEVAEASTDPIIRTRIRRGTLFHVDDDADGSPPNLAEEWAELPVDAVPARSDEKDFGLGHSKQ